MAKFDLEEYRAEIAKLKQFVQEMDEAVDNLKFECGPGGISDRAVGHLRLFLEALNDADKQQAEVARAMLKELTDAEI